MYKAFDYVPMLPLVAGKTITKDNFEVQLVEPEDDWRDCHVIRRYRITNLDQASKFETHFYAVSTDPQNAFSEFCEQTDCVVYDGKTIVRVQGSAREWIFSEHAQIDGAQPVHDMVEYGTVMDYVYKIAETNEQFSSPHVDILSAYREFKSKDE